MCVSEGNDSGMMFLDALAGVIMRAPGNHTMGVSTIRLAITASDLGAPWQRESV
jgi:hypothetical protein